MNKLKKLTILLTGAVLSFSASASSLNEINHLLLKVSFPAQNTPFFAMAKKSSIAANGY